jgi:hypothetical protein
VRSWHSPVLSLVLVTLPACGMFGGGSEQTSAPVNEDLTIVVEADKSRILQEEQSLQQKKQSFEQERERLSKERSDVEQKLSSLSKKDKRQREELEAQQKRLADEERRVRERASTFENERQKLEDDKNKLLDRISKMTATKGGLTIEQREQAIAQREKDVAEREHRVAQREAEASNRIAELSKVLAELQASGGLTKTVVVNNPTVAPSGGGGGGNRASALKMQKQVRSGLDSKGLLLDDLPQSARELYKNGNEAFEAKDFDSATQSYSELAGIIDGIQINRAFVEAKMLRINKMSEKKQLDAKGQGLLQEISDASTEGRWDRANKKINQVLALLQK